ncbi:MAG: hypothetical protein ACJASY_004170 [Halioglobus sp.]|jgi:hypothetical protein
MAVNAGVISYIDRSAWEAAAGNVTTENFNAKALYSFSGGSFGETVPNVVGPFVFNKGGSIGTGVIGGTDSHNIDGSTFVK